MFNFVDSSSVPVLEQVIGFAQRRHDVLAGNIANINTPGYKTRDLNVNEFHNRLEAALEAREAPNTSSFYGSESPGLAGPSLGKEIQADDALREVGDHLEDILYHDESNVSLEQQVAAVSKNQFMHNMAVALLRSQYDTLRAAVSERV